MEIQRGNAYVPMSNRGMCANSNQQRPYNPRQMSNNNSYEQIMGSSSHMPKSTCSKVTIPKERTSCGCDDDSTHMSQMPLTMTFISMQPWGELNDPMDAIMEGTLFPALSKPFCGVRRI